MHVSLVPTIAYMREVSKIETSCICLPDQSLCATGIKQCAEKGRQHGGILKPSRSKAEARAGLGTDRWGWFRQPYCSKQPLDRCKESIFKGMKSTAKH